MGRPRLVDKEHPHDGRVYVLDPKHQSFNGVVYSRRSGGNYARVINGKERQLHAEVWEYHHGPIPEGYVVHHEHRLPDGTFDKGENNIDWLRLMTNSEHAAYHNRNRVPVEKICAWCGKHFMTTSSNRQYCSDECHAKYTNYMRRLRTKKLDRLANEKFYGIVRVEEPTIDPDDDKYIVRICPICQGTFKTPVNDETLTCNKPECISTIMRISHAKNGILKRRLARLNGLNIFVNKELGVKIRSLIIDGEPWFVGKDVARALGYKDTVNALKAHVSAEDKTKIDLAGVAPHHPYNDATFEPASLTTIISQEGLLDLISESRLPTAKIFRRWIFRVVIPKLIKLSMQLMSLTEASPPALAEPELTVEPIT